ncbi:hypothetical protein IKW72_07770 [bacterium]|nr:hypothetical protein [bacterium]
MKTIFKLIIIMFCASAISSYCEMVLDFETGEYYQINDAEAKPRKEADEKKKQAETSAKTSVQKRKADSSMTLPEDEMTEEEWQNEIKQNPWQKWVFLKEKPITRDFVNTSSNVVVITFLDYEGAERDGVTDMNVIKEKYCLCCVLHPGDKYVETHEGKNGLRFARYVQAHEYCEEAKLYGGLKCMDYKDFDGDGIEDWDEIKGIMIKLKVNNDIKEKLAFTKPGNKDTDKDGLIDGDEVYGKNGFVTDPTDPDTDGDGIPDKDDKNPLVSCKSKDPKTMPYEWAEYWSKGDKTLRNKLIDANGDCDNDGFTNADEKLLETDPTVPNREKIIYFPKHLVLRNIKDDEYESEFNILINTNVMTEVRLASGLWNDSSKNYLRIKYLASEPLHDKIFKSKFLYNEVVRDSKPHYKFAVVQPMAIHKYKVTYKKEGWFEPESIAISCYNVDHKVEYKKIEYKSLRFMIGFGKSHLPEKYPEIPKIKKPFPDTYSFSGSSNIIEFSHANIKYPWHRFIQVAIMQRNKVFLDKFFKYKDSYLDNDGYSPITKGEDIIVYKENTFSDEFLAICFGVSLAHERKIYLQGEYVPTFRTCRLTEDCSFVFKPDTMRNIRLQAKYGKEYYQKMLAEEKGER